MASYDIPALGAAGTVANRISTLPGGTRIVLESTDPACEIAFGKLEVVMTDFGFMGGLTGDGGGAMACEANDESQSPRGERDGDAPSKLSRTSQLG